MKVSMFALLITLFSAASFGANTFNFYVTQVECSGVPNWIRFNLASRDVEGNFKGSGIENYLNFDLSCKISPEKDKISCTSEEGVKATIVIDAEGIVTANFSGAYHKNIKVGCIAHM
jgi:hypothetical protein